MILCVVVFQALSEEGRRGGERASTAAQGGLVFWFIRIVFSHNSGQVGEVTVLGSSGALLLPSTRG